MSPQPSSLSSAYPCFTCRAGRGIYLTRQCSSLQLNVYVYMVMPPERSLLDIIHLTWQFRSAPKLSQRSSGSMQVGDRREGGSAATLPGGVLNCWELHLWVPVQHLPVIHSVTLDKPGNLSHLVSTRKPPNWCLVGCTSQCDPKQ